MESRSRTSNHGRGASPARAQGNAVALVLATGRPIAQLAQSLESMAQLWAAGYAGTALAAATPRGRLRRRARCALEAKNAPGCAWTVTCGVKNAWRGGSSSPAEGYRPPGQATSRTNGTLWPSCSSWQTSPLGVAVGGLLLVLLSSTRRSRGRRRRGRGGGRRPPRSGGPPRSSPGWPTAALEPVVMALEWLHLPGPPPWAFVNACAATLQPLRVQPKPCLSSDS
jgi:hypothetical protein